MCVGFAIVSMVGTNFTDSKLIKGDSAPGLNEIFYFLFIFFIFFFFGSYYGWSHLDT